MSTPIKILLCLFALAVSGCASTQKIRTVIPNPSGVNTRPANFEIVSPPDRVWEPLPLDVTWSHPLEIREYKQPLNIHPETVAAVYEVELTGSTATIKTLDREYVFSQPADGETTTIRTSNHNARASVEGQPKVEYTEHEIKRPGFFGRFWRWGAVIAALGGGLFLWLKLKGDQSDKALNKIIKVMTLGALQNINRK